jgi:Cu-processing system permease protein
MQVADRRVGAGAARTLAGWEYRGSVRARWVLVMAVVFALTCLAVTLLSFRNVRALGLTGIGPASAALVNLGVLVPSLMGMLLGAGSLAGSREDGLLPMLAAQPIRRSALATGAFVGLTGSLWVTLGLGYGVAAVVLSGVVRADDLPALVALVGATFGVAAASVAIGVAISAAASTRAQAVAAAVGVWILTALGLDLALAALAPALQLGPTGLLVAILLNPLEAGRVLALLGTNLRGSALGPFGAYLVSTFGSGGAVAILVLALATWVLVPLQVARVVLPRKDL